jgi:hypothetical protein
MSKLAFVTLSTLVLVSWAYPTVNDVVPEEMLLNPSPTASFLESIKDKSADEVMKMTQTLLRQEPESIKALNDAIGVIIQDVVTSHKASQKLINEEIDSYATCAAMPLVDADANANAANKVKLVDATLKELSDAQTGDIDYDFGQDTTQSAIAADGLKTAIDAYKQVFDDAYSRSQMAQTKADEAQTASDKADEAATAANHQCYCAARKAYDDVCTAAKESNKNDKANIKHFQMIQCVMTEFGGENRESAFTTCAGKTFDDEVVTLDYRKSDAELDASITCE